MSMMLGNRFSTIVVHEDQDWKQFFHTVLVLLLFCAITIAGYGVAYYLQTK